MLKFPVSTPVGEPVKNVLPGLVEQQLSVMTEIGIAAKLTDIPGCVIARCDLGYEKDKLLALTDSILQKTEGTVKHPAGFVGKALSACRIRGKECTYGGHLLFAPQALVNCFDIFLKSVDLRLAEHFLFPVLLTRTVGTFECRTPYSYDIAQTLHRKFRKP